MSYSFRHTLRLGRRHKGIHQRGDAIGRHPLQLGRCQCRLFLQRRRRNLLIHKDRGAVGEVTGRRALSVAGDLATRYVRRFGSHPKQRKAAAVDPDRMPVIAPERDRPFRLDAVEVLGRRREAVIVELRRLEPFVGAALVLGEAILDDRLQRVDRCLHPGKAAFGAVERADDGMDVGVDQARQHQLAGKVDDLRLWPDQRRHIGVVADGDNGIAGEGKRLPDRARGVSRVDLAVAQNDIGLGLLLCLGAGGREPRKQSENRPCRHQTPPTSRHIHASLVPAYLRPSRTSLASLMRAAR